MTAALAGDADMPLSLGYPQNGAALGAFEKAIQILLPAAGFDPAGNGRQGRNLLEIPLVLRTAAGNVPAENAEIAENQADQRQQPEHGAGGAL